jgi:DNA uptake protein ComE-like DNA-binding protein
MTQQNVSRRHDHPIQLGPHGYRIEGDQAAINAELQVPPHHAGGEWMLELWASDQAYKEGALTGLKIAGVPVALPTPIGPYLHQVDAWIPARLPLQGRAHAMVLALIRRDSDGQTTVGAFANYAEPQTFIAPHFTGRVGHQLRDKEVVLEAEGIFNPRIDGNVSGTLSLELWAFAESGASPEGVRLAAAEIGTVSGQYLLPAIERRVALSEPAVGRYRLAMLLCEWTAADGYVARDRHDLASIYERAATVAVVASPAPVTPVAPEAAAEKKQKAATPVEAPSAVSVAAPAKEAVAPAATAPAKEAVAPAATAPAKEAAAAPATAPVKEAIAAAATASVKEAVAAPVTAPAKEAVAAAATAPAPAAASRLVSIQTASVEELAMVEGLNVKLAKEIIKARPFTSLADLSRVRGLGATLLPRLKSLLTL